MCHVGDRRALLLSCRVLWVSGAGEGNRTLVVSLEGFCSTIELHPPDELIYVFLPLSAPSSCLVRHTGNLWWRRLDSNQRRRKPTDLQSAPFNHSGTPPRRTANYGLVTTSCQTARERWRSAAMLGGQGGNDGGEFRRSEARHRQRRRLLRRLACKRPLPFSRLSCLHLLEEVSVVPADFELLVAALDENQLAAAKVARDA